MKKTRWGRIFWVFTGTLIVLLAGLDILAAWIFVRPLIFPGCPVPVPLSGAPIPEEVQLQSSDGVQIPAWYYPSRNGAAVIALGGLGGSLGTALPPAESLIEAGYGVLQIGSRACATPVQPVTLGAKEVNDAKAGLKFLLSRPEVEPDRIGIFGFSMGGVGAIRTAARNPEISAVLAEGGYYNLGNDFVEPGSGESFIRKIFLYTIAGIYWVRTGVNPWQVSPVDEIALLTPRPLLLIYGELEAESGRAQLQFDAAGEPKALWVVPAGDHGQNHLIAPDEFVERVVGFFDHALLDPK